MSDMASHFQDPRRNKQCVAGTVKQRHGRESLRLGAGLLGGLAEFAGRSREMEGRPWPCILPLHPQLGV